MARFIPHFLPGFFLDVHDVAGVDQLPPGHYTATLVTREQVNAHKKRERKNAARLMNNARTECGRR